jgi:AAA+ ATPase superfamily predicted ATPase
MAGNEIIGRKEELEIFNQIRRSKEAEFVAVYGRRRVGKTFLIREYFSDKGIYFETAGVKNLSLPEQLENFSRAFSKTFFNNIPLQVPKSWKKALDLLTQQIKAVPENKKIIIFLDELPWLASKRSGLISALDSYWNLSWSRIPNLILIVCGSAASWMLEFIVNAKGGLYNRLTKRILLESFNLRETSDFLKSRNINLKNKQILDLYMALGGIPYYLKEVEKGLSTSQIIDRLCFQKNGVFYSEFKNTFRSLFEDADENLEIVKEIAKAGNSISREQLIKATKTSSGGTFNRRIEELEASGFIKCFIPLGKKVRDRFYRIIDEYTLFYLKWIEPLINSGVFSKKKGYWQKIVKKPERTVWSGYAFENICFKHIDQIIHSLGIEDLIHSSGSWRYIPRKKSTEDGAQVDILFDRDDNAITLCEIKYSDKPFVIDKSYAKSLLQKIEVFENHFPTKKFPTKKQIFLSFITTYGLKKNMYSEDLVQSEVVLDNLFKA